MSSTRGNSRPASASAPRPMRKALRRRFLLWRRLDRVNLPSAKIINTHHISGPRIQGIPDSVPAFPWRRHPDAGDGGGGGFVQVDGKRACALIHVKYHAVVRDGDLE